MKTRLLSFLIVILPFLSANAQWNTYTENFDNPGNWTSSTPAAYGQQDYISSVDPVSDLFTTNNSRRMINSGFYSSPYNWRLNVSVAPVYLRYVVNATIHSFSFYMSRLSIPEDPTVVIRYSTNSGSTWNVIETINAAWFNGTNYKQYSHVFATPVIPEYGEEIYIEIYKTYGVFVNIDNFVVEYAPPCTWTGEDNNDWDKEANWTGGVPGQFSLVTIPSGLTNYPTINVSADCYNLYIASGASLINNSSLTIHNNAYVFRNITGTNEFHFISSPVANPQIGNIFPVEQYDNIWLRRFDEPTGNWMNMYIPSTMATGTGYSFYMDEPSTTVTFTGALNNSNVNPVLSYAGNTGDPDYDNWNLLGNPFTSALDWDLGTWNRSGLNGAVYIWDEGSGNYVSWNGSSGGLTNGLIPAQQGFFVKVENESGPAITIPANARTHANDGFLKNQANPSMGLYVQNSVNTYTDKTFLEINSSATNDFDTQSDAYKLDGNTDAPSLFTVVSGKNLSINALQQINNNQSIPVFLKPGVEADFTITASGVESLTGISSILLQDIKTGVSTDLKSENFYSFQATPGDDQHRFNLIFGTLGIDDNVSLNASVYSNQKNLYIRLKNNFSGEMSIMNVMGQTVMSSGLNGSNSFTINTELPAGVYLVKVSDKVESITRKVFIH